MKRLSWLALLLLALAPASRALDTFVTLPPVNVDGAQDFQMHAFAGAVTTLSGDTTSAVQPFVYMSVDAPTWDSDLAPHLLVNAALTASPGDSLNANDPSTWRAIEFGVGIGQPLPGSVHFDLYGEVGFGTRLPGSTEPLVKTARWASGGVRFRSTRGMLALGIGADQRLTGTYRPAVTITGAVEIWKSKLDQQGNKTLGGAKMMLVMSAVLGLDAPGSTGAYKTRDVVRVGVALGV